MQRELARAADALAALKSTRFTLDREGTPAVLDETIGITFTTADCSYAAPDSASCNIKVALRNGTILQLTRVWVPEGAFQSNPLTRQFAKLPADDSFNGSVLFARRGIPGILRSGVQRAQIVGKARLQTRDQVGVIGDRLEFARQLTTDAVEVRADADVIDAHQLHPVVDLVEHLVQRAGSRRMRSFPRLVEGLARFLRLALRLERGIAPVEVGDGAKTRLGGRGARRVDEGGAERHLHHAALGRHGLGDLVADVALEVGGEMAERGMAGDHRYRAQRDRLLRRRIAQVRNIDHDPEPVHFTHRFAAERAEPVPFLLQRVRRIGHAVVGAVGEGDVTHAAVEEELHVLQFVAERGAVLHAQRQQHAAALREPVGIAR